MLPPFLPFVFVLINAMLSFKGRSVVSPFLSPLLFPCCQYDKESEWCFHEVVMMMMMVRRRRRRRMMMVTGMRMNVVILVLSAPWNPLCARLQSLILERKNNKSSYKLRWQTHFDVHRPR